MFAIRTLVLAAAVLLTPAALVLAGPGKGGGQPAGTIKVEGVITGVNLATGQVAITMRNGVVAVVVAGPTTKLERNGVRVPLSAFRLGDRGQAIAFPNGAATKIEAVGL